MWDKTTMSNHDDYDGDSVHDEYDGDKSNNMRILNDEEVLEAYMNPRAAFDPSVTTAVKARAKELARVGFPKNPATPVGLPCRSCSVEMIKRPDAAACTHHGRGMKASIHPP